MLVKQKKHVKVVQKLENLIQLQKNTTALWISLKFRWKKIVENFGLDRLESHI